MLNYNKTGHTFDEYIPSDGTLIAAGVILIAHWTINKYTVTVDLNDGFFDYISNGWTRESD